VICDELPNLTGSWQHYTAIANTGRSAGTHQSHGFAKKQHPGKQQNTDPVPCRQPARPRSSPAAGREPPPLCQGTLGSEKPTPRAGGKTQGLSHQGHRCCHVYLLPQRLLPVTRTGPHNKVPTLYKTYKIMSAQVPAVISSRDYKPPPAALTSMPLSATRITPCSCQHPWRSSALPCCCSLP